MTNDDLARAMWFDAVAACQAANPLGHLWKKDDADRAAITSLVAALTAERARVIEEARDNEVHLIVDMLINKRDLHYRANSPETAKAIGLVAGCVRELHHRQNAAIRALDKQEG